MTTPDPTPLAQRLVQAAFEARHDEDKISRVATHLSPNTAAAVVAVLRELAEEHTSRDGNWLAIPPPMLIGLADSIEKGEG